MLEIIFGVVSGLVTGMGMGGGTILILCLSLFSDLEQHIAQATNLVFFIPTSIVAIIVNIKEKLINWKIAVPICISGIVGAILGAIVSNNMDVSTLRKCFGIFLSLIAIYQIYIFFKSYIFHKNTNNTN